MVKLDAKLKQCEALIAEIKVKFHQSSSGAQQQVQMDDLENLLADLQSTPAPRSPAAAPVPARSPRGAVAAPKVQILGGGSSRGGPTSAKLWSVDQVAAQLLDLKVSDASIQKLRAERVDGEALLCLTAEDLKDELGLPLGDRKKVQQLIDTSKS